MPDTMRPVAHWPLNGHTDDIVGPHHGQARAVQFSADAPAGLERAAVFDGKQSVVRIADHPALRLGTRDFALCAWVKCEPTMTHIFGDVLAKWDPVGRSGVHLYLAGASPAYSSMSDQRHAHFGIDDGYASPWQDLGKPEPTSASVTSLITFQGALYAGIADAATADRACRVFRHDGQQRWTDCGRLGDDAHVLSVQSMLVHEDTLYAGTGNWDWAKAQDAFDGFTPGFGHVYAYEGGQQWRDMGQVGRGRRVMSLASFDGQLFAGLDAGDGQGRVYQYLGDQQWRDCGSPDGKNIEGFLPSGGRLHVATHGSVFQYDGGQRWRRIAHDPFGINQIHCLAEADGALHLGTWPQGYVLRNDPSTEAGLSQWTNIGRLGIPKGLHECNEVMDLRVHNGKLYAGLIPKAQVWRYEADGQWTMLASLASRPDFCDSDIDTWSRITCLETSGGQLVAGTSSCFSRATDRAADPHDSLGRVHAMMVGQLASHEHDIGHDWTHLAAVRAGDRTQLYINGHLSATAPAPPGRTLDLTNASPLTLGAGPGTFFRGQMADVQLYAEALDAKQIAAISESA